VGKGEVHQAVAPAVGDGGHHPVLCQFSHALLVHIGKEDADHIITTHHLFSSSASIMALGGTTVPGAILHPGPMTATPQSSLFSISSGRSPTTAPAPTTEFSATMAYCTLAPSSMRAPGMTMES